MKHRNLFISILAALSLASCIQEELPESLNVTGMWAVVNERLMASEFVKFDDGKIYESKVTGSYAIVDKTFWNYNDVTIFEKGSRYTTYDGILTVNSRNLGQINVDGDKLTLGKKQYVRFDSFSKEYYSKINVDASPISDTYAGGSHELPVSVTNQLPNTTVNATKSGSFIVGLTISDGKMSFSTEANKSDASGSITISCPGAADVVIPVKREQKTFVEPEYTKKDFGYTAQSGTLKYSISGALEGESLSVTTEASWIKDIKVNAENVQFSLEENNSGSSRNATLVLSYRDAKDVNVTITQAFSSSVISTAPASQSTDYTAKGLSFTYSVSNPKTGVTMSASSSSTWITNVTISGSTVSYKVGENNTGSSRSGSIKLTYGTVTKTFSVSQSSSSTGITLSPTSASTDYTGKSMSFTYAIQDPREGVSLSAVSQNDWITNVVLSGSTVSYKVSENNTGSSRSGSIKLTYGTVTKTFSVGQTSSATSINLTPTSASTDYTSKSLSFTYTIKDPREGVSLSATSQNDWITNVVLSGSTVSYMVSENNTGSSRSGSIKLTYGTLSKTFTVTQTFTAAEITTEPDNASTDYTAKKLSLTFSVANPKAGVEMGASSSDTWITDIAVSGSSVTYKVTENNSGSSRTGTIKLTYGTVSKEFTVSQTSSSTAINLSSESASTDYTGKNLSFTYTIKDPREGVVFSAISQDDWISNVVINGSTVSYKVSENNSGTSRNGSIKLTYGTVTKTFSVNQTSSATSITFSPASEATSYTSKSLSFTYTIKDPREGCSVSASSQNDWITDVSVSGNTVSYKVAENNSGAVRSGSIKLAYGTLSTSFKVTQSYTAAEITTDPDDASTDYTAKKLSFTFSVANPRAGVGMNVSSSDTWITDVSVSGSSVSYKVSENNTGTSRSGSILLIYGTVTKTFTVSQTSSATSISLTPTSASTDYTSKGLSFTYTINDPREGVSLSAISQNDWISNVLINGSTVSYNVSENNSGTSRSGSIKLTYGTVTKTFSVKQTYTTSVITTDPTSQSTDYTAKGLSFTYSISNPKTGVTMSASSSSTWITDVAITGSTVSYKVAENNTGSSRSGSIKLTYITETKSLTVVQTSSYTSITLSSESESTDYIGKNLSFTYSIKDPREGVSFSAISQDDWITDVSISGSTVSYKVSENNTGSSRSGIIKLTYGTVTKDFSVSQTYTAAVITTNPVSQSTDCTAKILSFSFSVANPKTGDTLSATSQNAWITDVSISGNTVSYKVSENNASARDGSITMTYGIVTQTFSVSQGPVELIDLGLSVKWRSWNLGASVPEEAGLFYQWGDTQGYGSSTSDGKYFDWKDNSGNVTYKWCRGSRKTLTKYNFDSDYGSTVDNKKVLALTDDAARAALGGKWRMPTADEWEELRNTSNCSWTWTIINGVKGYKVQSKKSGYTDKWIFLPASGYRTDNYLFGVSSTGYYWSSSLSTSYPDYAIMMLLRSGSISQQSTERCQGLSVRPVSD